MGIDWRPTDEDVDRFIAELVQPTIRYAVAYCPHHQSAPSRLDSDTIGYHCLSCGYRIPWEYVDAGGQ